MNGYVIREGRPEDSDKYYDYLKCIFEETDFLTCSPEEITKTPEEITKFIKKCISTDNFLFLIAEYEGDIVGNLTFRGGEKSRIRHSGEFGITIVKSSWGKGLAGKLIEKMISWAEENDIIKKINLVVREDNKRAIELYKRFGFRKEGFTSKYFYHNGKYYDTVNMGMDIEAGFQYDISFNKNIDITTVRDFYCRYATWKVPVLSGDWARMVENSQLFVTVWNNNTIIAAGRALSDKVRWATIVDVLVDPDYRNKGVGTRMLKALLAKDEMNVRSISISSDEATGFYEKLGFSNISDVSTYMIKTNMDTDSSYIIPVQE